MIYYDVHPTCFAAYQDEHVDLDGKEWHNCVFKNCTFSATMPIIFKRCVVTDGEMITPNVYRFIFGCDPPKLFGIKEKSASSRLDAYAKDAGVE